MAREELTVSQVRSTLTPDDEVVLSGERYRVVLIGGQRLLAPVNADGEVDVQDDGKIDGALTVAQFRSALAVGDELVLDGDRYLVEMDVGSGRRCVYQKPKPKPRAKPKSGG